MSRAADRRYRTGDAERCLGAAEQELGHLRCRTRRDGRRYLRELRTRSRRRGTALAVRLSKSGTPSTLKIARERFAGPEVYLDRVRVKFADFRMLPPYRGAIVITTATCLPSARLRPEGPRRVGLVPLAQPFEGVVD